MKLFNEIKKAQLQLNQIVINTPLSLNINLSNEFDAQIFLKREDLQVVRSYKIRGAYNKISTLNEAEQQKGIVCASAGNHAQGVAHSCNLLNIRGTIFMPVTTPKQKIKQVQLFGKKNIEIVLAGDTFDDAQKQALAYCTENKNIFVHPFDDEKVIAGQGTVGLEIIQSMTRKIDYAFVPIGGGGLAAGVATVFKLLSPGTKIIGVEPEGAPAMKVSISKGMNTTLEEIDKFVDGAAVKRVGEKTFEICKNLLDDITLVPEGKVCSTILQLYNEEAMVVEPAGALTIAALCNYRNQLKNKTAVCVVSGSNNDITRTEEIKERALFYHGLKHYFMVQFPQRPGALKEFVTKVLGPNDDITYFQFSKKNNKESGPAVIGIELENRNDLDEIKLKLKTRSFNYTYLNENQELFTQLIG